jgi:hypothetical protein
MSSRLETKIRSDASDNFIKRGHVPRLDIGNPLSDGCQVLLLLYVRAVRPIDQIIDVMGLFIFDRHRAIAMAEGLALFGSQLERHATIVPQREHFWQMDIRLLGSAVTSTSSRLVMHCRYGGPTHRA